MYWSTVPLARASSSKTHGTDTIEQKISNDLPWKKPPRQVINYYIAKKARPAKVLLQTVDKPYFGIFAKIGFSHLF